MDRKIYEDQIHRGRGDCDHGLEKHSVLESIAPFRVKTRCMNQLRQLIRAPPVVPSCVDSAFLGSFSPTKYNVKVQGLRLPDLPI